jgi:outer membrane protein OmpA-like peptidoglycan-associated protein
MLIAELISRGAFSNQAQPTFAGMLQGNILLKGNRGISYYYQNNNFTDYDQFYTYNRMWAAYKQDKFFVRVGDIIKSLDANMQGKGIESEASFNNISFTAIATKNIRTEMLNAGAIATYKVNSKLSVFGGAAYNHGTQYSVSSPMAILGSNFSIKNQHNFIIKGLYNPISFSSPVSANQYNYNAYGGELYYNAKVASNQIRLRARYGSDFLNTSYGGRTSITLNSTQWFKNRSNLIFRFSYTGYQPYTFRDNPEIIKPFNINLSSEVHYGRFIAPKIFIYAGPGIELPKTDVFSSIITGTDFFSTRVGKFNLGTRMIGLVPNQTINLQVIFGYVSIGEAPALVGHTGPTTPHKPPFTYQEISASIRNPKWSVQAMYTNGPRSVFDHFSWNYNSRQSRYLRVMPSFRSFIFKDIIELESSISYNNDLVTRSSYTNFTNQITLFLPNNWQIRGLNVYSMQSRVTPTETVERYQNLYFEFAARKEFGFQQPRQKFYDLNLVFFKDFNGDGKQDPNEPGIQNVYVNIQRNDDPTSDISSFVSSELLSDHQGRVSYTNIPEGIYEITYYPVDKNAGTYTKAVEDLSFNLEKNTTNYLPFVEKNKVFGSIILNRSRLSGLGRIDLSNIRITTTDSHGRSFSTLTNKDGYFELFAPVTDEYIVNVNNVFYENFDLRQNNFLVQFNGYKQFEVNFVFDEKVRRINFAATDSDLRSGIQQVRRTTISGTIKDANTQQPVRAKVNLVNTRTNAVSTSANSSATSGEYTLSFIAGDNYLLEVIADDYWYLSENLVLEQITTFMNISRDVLLKPVTVGSSIDLNIRFGINSSFLAPESVAELNRLIRQLKDNPTVRLELQGHCDNLEALKQPGIALERANTVGKYLVENGFSNFELKSMGNTNPLTNEETEEGRSQNRRVGVMVLSR